MHTLVHIGQHKTGTTSIQQCLQDQHQSLIKQGIYYPTSLCGHTNRSHFALNLYALEAHRHSPKKETLLRKYGQQQLDEIIAAVPDAVAGHYHKATALGCDRVLWSNEGLYLLNSVAEYQKLLGLFTSCSERVTAICCFRDLASYRTSYMGELRKLNRSPSADPDSFRYVEADSWLFDYDRKKDLLSAVFDDVICFAYDAEDNVANFCEQADIDASVSQQYRLNISEMSRQP